MSGENMKIVAENRRARFDFEILETFEAGIELLGHEVKSVKSGRMVLSGSHAIIRAGECFLVNAQIPPYQPNNVQPDYDPARTRRLLLTSRELSELSGKLQQKGFSLIALEAIVRRGLVKIKLGLSRARKKHDKRELIRKREAQKEMKS